MVLRLYLAKGPTVEAVAAIRSGLLAGAGTGAERGPGRPVPISTNAWKFVSYPWRSILNR